MPLNGNDQAFEGRTGDHYVALLSNGTKPLVSKRPRAVGSKLAKLSAIAVALVIIGALVLLLCHPASDPDQLKSVIAKLASSPDFILMNGDAFLNRNNILQSFEAFVANHGKVYSSMAEKARRLEIFARNLLFIQLHNSQNFTYSLAANAFTDLTFNEFQSIHFTGYRQRGLLGTKLDDRTDWNLLKVDPETLPDAINWKEKGCVTDVKDQQKW